MLLFILVCATPTIVFAGEKAIYSTFTSNKWQKRVTARFLMVDDMLEKNKLIGKDKKEILELLGKQTPYEDVSVSIPKDSNKKYLVYYLGKSIDGVMHSETDYLVIYFKNSNVVEHKILTYTYDF
ncbi:hypothetical protein [Oceanirhabdus seepicola]|uniref:Uncharacterized protein n=1 Tax=Oceanirhabdus seepicola TaxID=2828781 RepID=A0A9J6NY48_9CLOT|nr:hypothetical protein [Oceanirhabdus seepicola]MCM1989187.1 hypothetical protein [Oceanirhabdus seepicola]